MPRLQILQHKSYHPYLEKNKQRVREDEAKAAEAEMAKEQKRVEKDSEARLVELRRRAGSPSVAQADDELEDADDNLPSTSTTKDLPVNDLLEKHRKKKAREEKRERKQRDRLDFEFPSETSARRDKGKGKDKEKESASGIGRIAAADQNGDTEERSHDRSWDDHGHINFFQDVEQAAKPKPAPTLAEINKKKLEQEADKFTMYLGRPEREMKPWYTDRELKRVEEKAVGEEAEYRRARDQRKDVRSKERNDPLTQVKALLKPSNPPARRHPSSTPATTPKDPQTARANREQSERERALALIAKSKAQPRGRGTWEDTPSTIAGTGANGGRSWAEDLERQKDKAKNRFWDEERERDRVRGWEKGVRGERGGRAWEV